MYVYLNVARYGHVSATVHVLARLVKRCKPVGMAVLEEAYAVLPVHLRPQAQRRSEPASQRSVDAERLAVGEHVGEIAPVGVLQRHVETYLHVPVCPERRHLDFILRSLITAFLREGDGCCQ